MGLREERKSHQKIIIIKKDKTFGFAAF